MKKKVDSLSMLAKRWLNFSQWRSNSLVVDSTVRIFLVGIGLALLFAFASMMLIRDNETKRLTRQVNELLSTVESAVRVACFVGDATLAIDVAKGLLTNRLVAGVKITSGKQVLAEEKKVAEAGGNATDNYVVQRRVSSPFSANESVGVIELTADSAFIHAQAAHYSIMSSIILMLEVLAVAWVVAVVMLRTVVRPIRLFSNQMHTIQITSGEHVSPPEGNAHNEIGQLANDFNQMIDKMSTMFAVEQVMRETLALNEQRFRTLVENSPDIIVRYDRDCRRIFVNPVFARETGTPIEQILNKSTDDISVWRPTMPREEYRTRLQQVMDSGVPDQILLEWVRLDGQWVSHEMYVVAEYDIDGQVIGTLAIGRDVTQRKAVEQQLLFHASYDALTGLPNRRMFSDRLREDIVKADRNGKTVALLFVDLDRFKEVNDILGHEAGDHLLIDAAQRIRNCVRESDTVARLGGDEFVVIFPEVVASSHLARVAQAIVDSLAKPFNLDENSARISASIGIAIYPRDADNQESLIECADQAMYTAKGLGRNRFSFFTQDVQEQA
jgi:diguanylate cyclase (GGDEF)-like protein/PAS domain S-box-containing protein